MLCRIQLTLATLRRLLRSWRPLSNGCDKTVSVAMLMDRTTPSARSGTSSSPRDGRIFLLVPMPQKTLGRFTVYGSFVSTHTTAVGE